MCTLVRWGKGREGEGELWELQSPTQREQVCTLVRWGKGGLWELQSPTPKRASVYAGEVGEREGGGTKGATKSNTEKASVHAGEVGER